MNTRTGFVSRTLPVHLMYCFHSANGYLTPDSVLCNKIVVVKIKNTFVGYYRLFLIAHLCLV